MDPSIWGPPLWAVLHGAAVGGAPVTLVRRTLTAMETTLPCRKCRESLPLVMARVRPTSDSFHLTWQAHNGVNRKTRKPELPLDRARRRWTVTTVAVCPLALVDALLVVACNFCACPDLFKHARYEELWKCIAGLCGYVHGLVVLGGALAHTHGAWSNMSQLVQVTNRIRTKLLRERSLSHLRLTDGQAKHRFCVSRKKRAQPGRRAKRPTSPKSSKRPAKRSERRAKSSKRSAKSSKRFSGGD